MDDPRLSTGTHNNYCTRFTCNAPGCCAARTVNHYMPRPGVPAGWVCTNVLGDEHLCPAHADEAGCA